MLERVTAGKEVVNEGSLWLLGFLVSIFVQLLRIRRTPAVTELQRRLHLESIAIEVALVGLLVAGFFVNRLYSEALYLMAGLTAALTNVAMREAKQAAEAPGVAAAPDPPARAAAGSR